MDDEPVRGGYPDPRLLSLPGVDRVRAGITQQMPPPPIHHLFGLKPVNASPVSVTFSMPCSPWLQTGAGVFGAGTAALVADAALGGAVMAPLGPGKIVVTSDLSFNFLRPVGVGSGQLIARARPIEVGRSLGLAESLVEDGRGRIVAHSTTRCFVVSMEPPESSEDLPHVEVPVYDTPDPHERPLPDGGVLPELLEDMTMLELLAEFAAGKHPPPPFAQLFAMHDMDVERGHFCVYMPATLWHTSPAGTVYGGLIAYLADSVLAGAFGTTSAVDEVAALLDLKVQFLRPVLPDGRDLKAEAHVVHRGRSFATAQAEITNADGKIVALATSSAAIRSGRSWASFVVADEAPRPPDSDS
ncbi:MAG: PaaI family thioesterase [Actinomycetota bacterium]